MSTFAKHFSHVAVTRRVSVLDGRFSWDVFPVWNGVDRPETGGYGVSSAAIAARLADALATESTWQTCQIMRDVNGKTYVMAQAPIYGRTMNADLKRLGF